MKKATAKKSSKNAKLQYKEFVADFKARLLATRMLAGLSQQKLGEACGWNGESGQVKVSTLESGNAVPDLLDILALAEACRVQPHTLAFGPDVGTLSLAEERLLVTYRTTDEHGREFIEQTADIASRRTKK